MTVSSATNNETFFPNGVTTIWDLPFRFFENADLRVYVIDPVANTTMPLILGTDYTLTGAGLPEQFGTAPGKLTTSVAYPSGLRLYVERVMDIEQLTDITNQGEFFAEIHEDAFDRLTMLIQQADANSQGAIRVAIGDPEPSRLPPAPLRANLLMGFDGLGNPIPVAPVSGSSSALALLLANDVNVTQGAAMIGRGIQVVKSIAELKTLLNSTPSKHAFVTGYYTQGDGGGGPYYLDLADVSSADNGGTIIVANDGGRWKLINQGTVSVRQFGAKGDGVTNDATALSRAAAHFGNPGGTVNFPFPGRYLIDTDVVLPRNITLSGAVAKFAPGSPFTNTALWEQTLKTMPSIILNPARTITLATGCGTSGIGVFRKGLALNGSDLATNYSGTAFTSAITDDLFFFNTAILGFEAAVINADCSRLSTDGLLFDCNNGIKQSGAIDVCRIRNTHGWDFLQFPQNGHTSVSNRSGIAFEFINDNGGPHFDNCFAYGYKKGFRFSGTGSPTLNMCWADGTTDIITGRPLVSDSNGFSFEGSYAEPQLVNCKAIAMGTGYSFSAGNYGSIHLHNVKASNCDSGYSVAGNNMTMTGFTARSCTNFGVRFLSATAANSASLRDGRFYDQVGGCVDINCGGGDPVIQACSNGNATFSVVARVKTTLSPASGIVTIPNGKQSVLITGGNITGLFPAYDGNTVELAFKAAGTLTTGTFLVAGGGSTFTAGANDSIGLTYRDDLGRWVEIYRTKITP